MERKYDDNGTINPEWVLALGRASEALEMARACFEKSKFRAAREAARLAMEYLSDCAEFESAEDRTDYKRGKDGSAVKA